MKKSLQLLCAGFLFSTSALAQLPLTPGTQGGHASNLSSITAAQKNVNSELRSMATCSDKVTYTNRYGTGTASDYVQVGGTGPIAWGAAMQSFPGYSGQITRIDFKGASYSGTKTVQASIHAIDASNTPIGSPLGSVNVNVSATTADYGANLPSPVTIATGGFGFAIVIWDISSGADSIKLFSNADGSGDMMEYSNLFYNANIYGVYSTFGADIDFLMYPTIQFNTPAIALSASPTTVCAGVNVSFGLSNSPTYPEHYFSDIFNPNGTAYSLNFGDATTPATTSSASHAYAAAGTYNAQLTEIYDGWTSNCNGDPSNTVAITVNPGVNSFFNWSANQLAVTFTNLSTAATTYAWLFGDAGTSAAPNPVHNYAASGTYTVELTATGPCGNDYYTTNISITDSTSGGNVGIQQIESQMFVNLFPNPVNDVFTLQVESSLTDDIQVEVLSPLGQVVATRTIAHTNSTAVAFDMSAYTSGVYFVRIVQGNSTMVKPVMKN